MKKPQPRDLPWQDLEKLVRKFAEAKFAGTARQEMIAGVKCDCVLDLHDGSVVVVEISKERTIDKLRTDLAKFNTIRPHFFQKNIFPRCYFVTLEEPTSALIDAGKSHHVQVYSAQQFFNVHSGLLDYITLRAKKPFGSAIDLYSGQPDDSEYVEVSYSASTGAGYTVSQISDELLHGKTVVLIGDYGAGKSRCVKQVFESLARSLSKHYHFPIAINLRDNWGLNRAAELATRHFDELGLSQRLPDAMRVLFSQACIFLLDGFDEIGTQTWSDDPARLVEIRKKSLTGVKDLVQKATSGILITGREHYFNDDAELATCLGLDSKQVLFLRCDQELSDTQFSQLLGQASKKLPQWIPKKPLIGTIIRDIGPELTEHIFSTSTGQVDFWELLLSTLCEREATINSILDPLIIRQLYSQIGRLARKTRTSLGPISIREINEAFERTTGYPPTDESATILQRLPGLSRIGAESLDRQFVDSFILDGLKAEDVLTVYSQSDLEPLESAWKHPIEAFGAFYLSTKILATRESQGIVAYLKRNRNVQNRVLLSDVLMALLFPGGLNVNLGGIRFAGLRFHHVSLADSGVSNATLDDCYFESLDISDAFPTGFFIEKSLINRLAGVTSLDYLPAWMPDCHVESFQDMNTLATITLAGLSLGQTFLLSSLRKLFLQPGSGRKEDSMYKGYGNLESKRICEKVISILIRQGFCQRLRGGGAHSNDLFLPNRSMTSRVRAMMSELTQSRDSVWITVSRLM